MTLFFYDFSVGKQNQTKSNKNDHYDVAIIGAGINGAVAAAAASAAGLKVLVVDKGDIANFTSQESSNLSSSYRLFRGRIDRFEHLTRLSEGFAATTRTYSQ